MGEDIDSAKEACWSLFVEWRHLIHKYRRLSRLFWRVWSLWREALHEVKALRLAWKVYEAHQPGAGSTCVKCTFRDCCVAFGWPDHEQRTADELNLLGHLLGRDCKAYSGAAPCFIATALEGKRCGGCEANMLEANDFHGYCEACVRKLLSTGPMMDEATASAELAQGDAQ